MIYLISDTHFYHDNIMLYANRHSAGIDKYIDGLIDYLQFIKDDDILLFLGDLALSTRKTLDGCKELVSQIRGQKHFIRGNHDKWLKDIDIFDMGFLSVQDYILIDDTLFCHYPFEDNKFKYKKCNHDYLWEMFFANPKIKTIYHGHIHDGRIPNGENTEHYWLKGVKRINCCVDKNHYGYNVVNLTKLDSELAKKLKEFFDEFGWIERHRYYALCKEREQGAESKES